MQVKNFDELEKQLNEIGAKLSIVNSLSKILMDTIYDQYEDNPQDTQNLLEVLNERVAELKKKFKSVQENLV